MASEGRNRGIREIRGSRQGKRFPFLFRVFRVFRGLIPVTTVPRSKSSPPASKLDYCSAEKARRRSSIAEFIRYFVCENPRKRHGVKILVTTQDHKGEFSDSGSHRAAQV